MKKCIGLVSIITLLGMGASAYAAPIENWVSLSLSNLPAKAKIGQTYSGVVLNVTNPNSQTIYLNQLLDPKYPAGFTVTSNACENISLAHNASCKVTGNYIPESVNQNVWSTRVAVEGVGWQKVYSASVVADGLDLDTDNNANKMIAFNGDSESKTITVTNNSAEALTNINAALVAPISGVTIAPVSNCSTNLAIGDSCTFTLTYNSPANPTNVNMQRNLANIDFTYGTNYATETLEDKVNIIGVKKGYYISLPTFETGSSLAANDAYRTVVRNQGQDLYVGTEGGFSISHDSGQTYRTYTTNDGLAANSIRYFDVSDDGQTIALGSNNGLSLSTDGGYSWTVKTTANGLGSDDVTDVKMVGGKIFVATYGGVSTSTDNGQTFQTVTTAVGLGSNNVYALAISADGQKVVAATYGGLSVSADGGKNFVNKTTANGLTSNLIIHVAMSADKQTIYTVNYYDGVNRSVDGGQNFAAVAIPGISGYTVNNVEMSPDAQQVFVTAGDGIAESADAGANFVVKTTANGLGSNSAYGITYDSETGKIYVATFGGLSQQANINADFTNQTSSQGLAGSDIRSLLLTNQGKTLYVGSYNGGLNESTDDGVSFTNDSSELAGTNVYRIINGPNDQGVYMATNKGVSILSGFGPSATYTNITSICGENEPSVNALYLNPQTNKVYAAISTGSLNALAIATAGFQSETCLTPTNSGLPNALLTGVATSSDGQTIYLGTNGGPGLGISTDAGQNFTMKTTADGLGSNHIENVKIENDGQTIYAPTYSGFSFSTNGGSSFTNYTTANGLASNNTNGIMQTNNGQTWYVPTTAGLSVSYDGGSTFSTISTANGLGSNNVRLPVLNSDSTGLYVPTDHGLFFTKFAL